ncbi:MAG: hypothetical protein HY814_03130 [Candidatus Riflebacteria bacterium]|nr:hypothetical protein [Candidatus Riflebacteria bacterium]
MVLAGGDAASSANDVAPTAMTPVSTRRPFRYARVVEAGDDGTFVVILAAADAAGNALRAQPAPRVFAVATPVSFVPRLGRVINFVSFPTSPADLPSMDSRAVLAQFPANLVGRLETTPGAAGFVCDLGAGGSWTPFSLRAGEGLLVFSRAAVERTMQGARWPDASRRQSLRRGLNLIGAPVLDSGLRANNLAGLTDARFVVRTFAGTGGRARLEVHLTSGTAGPDFTLEASAGYLLSLLSDATLD